MHLRPGPVVVVGILTDLLYLVVLGALLRVSNANFSTVDGQAYWLTVAAVAVLLLPGIYWRNLCMRPAGEEVGHGPRRRRADRHHSDGRGGVPAT